jgi:hypothetical protein
VRPPAQDLNLAAGLDQCLGVLLLDGQFQEDPGLLELFLQASKGVDALPQQGALFQDGRGGLRVVPEPVPGDLRLDFLQPLLLVGQVKDTP